MNEDERGELLAKLFYVMTAELEDAAGLAADGQGQDVERGLLATSAEDIRGAAQRVAIIAEAVIAILKIPSAEAASSTGSDSDKPQP